MSTPTEPDLAPVAVPLPREPVPAPAGWDDALRMAFAVDSTDAERLIGVTYLLELDSGADA